MRRFRPLTLGKSKSPLSWDDIGTGLPSCYYSKCAVIATPSLINSLIGLTKGTSLAFSAGIVEMYAQAQILGGAEFTRYFERYISVALVEPVISTLIEYIGRSVEKSHGH